jgi:hypothetical protein
MLPCRTVQHSEGKVKNSLHLQGPKRKLHYVSHVPFAESKLWFFLLKGPAADATDAPQP